MRPKFFVLLLPLFLGAQILGAARGDESARERATIDRWLSHVERADQAIKDKDYPEAERLAQRLIDEFDEQLMGGPEAKSYYGIALVRRALARSGLDRLAEAQWDWDVARSFLPELAAMAFSHGGEAPSRPVAPEIAMDLTKIASSADATVEQPKILQRKAPKYTSAGLAAATQGIVVIELIIDRDGRPRSPRIARSLDPGLDFAALESIRDWTFTPARWDGEPVVATHYFLTVKFQTNRSRFHGEAPFVVPRAAALRSLRAPQADPNNEGAPPPDR